MENFSARLRRPLSREHWVTLRCICALTTVLLLEIAGDEGPSWEAIARVLQIAMAG